MDGTPYPLDLSDDHGLSRPWRVAFSLAAAAVASALVAAAALSAMLISYSGGLSASDTAAETVFYLLVLFTIIFVYALALASAHVVLLGVPAFLIGELTGRIRWWSCLLLSFLIGALPLTVLPDGSNLLTTIRTADGRNMTVALGVLGAIGGLTFWLLWRFWINRRPAPRP